MTGCNWLTIVEMAEFVSLIQLFKVVRWKIPEYMRDRFALLDDGKLWTNKPRLLLTAEGWRCRTTVNWNNLPEVLRTELSLKAFKINLRRLIIERRTEILEPD